MPIYLYERFLREGCGNKVELLKTVRRHYQFAMQLFEDTANCTGTKSAVTELSGEGILAFEIRKE